MTKGEIVRSYREAKYKKPQIKILAELSCKTQKEIEAILIEAGETVPPRRTSKPKAKEPAEDPEGQKIEEMKAEVKKEIETHEPKKLKEMPEHVRNALTSELHRLDMQMEEIQNKKTEIINYMLEEEKA